MKIKKMSAVLGYLFMGYLFSTAMVAQVIEITLKELCEKSSDIIIAKTLTTKYYSEMDRKHIYTDIILEVIDSYKGDLKKIDQLKITQYGGVINGMKTFIVGAPQFPIGEVSFLFLNNKISGKDGSRIYYVLGMAQGKFNVITINENGEKQVYREHFALPLKLETAGITINLTNKNSLSLNSFIDKVKKYIQ